MATITVAMETMENNFDGHQNPRANAVYDLGTPLLKWKTLHSDSFYINGQVVPADKIAYIGSPNGDPLLKSGGNMSGDINWTDSGKGLAWGLNSDGAGIRFNNTSDQDLDSCLEFYTYDNNDEFFKWSHRTSGTENFVSWMELKRDGLTVHGKKVFTEGNLPTSSQLDAIGPKGFWSTNGGQDLIVHGKRALVGFQGGQLHLGYGGDFTDIRCGADYQVWHSGNVNSSTTLHIGAINSTQAYITMGGRTLYVSWGEPAGAADGSIWIK